MGFDYDVNDIGFEEDVEDDEEAYNAFMQSMQTAVKVPTLNKIKTDEVIFERKLTADEIRQEFGETQEALEPTSIVSSVTRLDKTEPVKPALSSKPKAEKKTTVGGEKAVEPAVPTVDAYVKTNGKAVEVEDEKRVSESVKPNEVVERDATKMVGDYQSIMPEVPEDQTIFEAVEDREPEEYKGGMVNITKYFEECEYPQIHIDTTVLEHSYVMNSLRALMVSNPITFKLPPGTRDPADIYNAKRQQGNDEEVTEESNRRRLSLTELQMRDENILKFTVLVDFEDGSIVKLPGVLFSSNLNSFLEAPVFSKVNKWIMLDENTKLTGDVMYALYTPIPEYTEEEMWIEE